MIYGSLKNKDRYALSENILKALATIETYTPENYAEGKNVLDGETVFLNLFSYETKCKSDAVAEAHRKYVDVMYVVSGEETIYVKDIASLKTTKEYEEEGDYLLGELDDNFSAIKLYPGMFLILFPEDAHAPGCNTDSKHRVQKIVGKVKL